jgi:eukaryotic-like serine/threonine-protein kinase
VTLPASPTPDVTLQAELGRGGAGVVYRGRQHFLDRSVAVKILHDDGPGDGHRERFAREARLLASLQHPHIVACHQAGISSDGRAFLIMELVDGPSLRQWIDIHGSVAAPVALAIIAELAAGLGHANGKGIIHRDMKPENVLLAAKPDAAPDDPFPWVAKIADLGLARHAVPTGDGLGVTQQGTVVGTPSSMAPEQFEAPETVDHRADIYGLGCILIHLVTGRQPYASTSLGLVIQQKFRDEMPELVRSLADDGHGVKRLAMAMLQRHRDRRPGSYTEVIARCAAVPTGPASRLPIAPIAVAAALAAAALAWWAWPATASPAPTSEPAALLADPVATPVPDPVAHVVEAPPTPAAAPVPAPTPSALPAAVIDPAALVWGDAAPLLTGVRAGLPGWIGVRARHSPDDETDGLVLGSGLLERALDPLPRRIAIRLRPAPGLHCDTALCGLRLADGSLIAVTLQDLGPQTVVQVGAVTDDGQVTSSAPSPVVLAAPDAWQITLIVLPDRLVPQINDTPLPSLPLAHAPMRLVLGHAPAAVGARGGVLVEDVSWSAAGM